MIHDNNNKERMGKTKKKKRRVQNTIENGIASPSVHTLIHTHRHNKGLADACLAQNGPHVCTQQTHKKHVLKKNCVYT